MYPVPEQPCQTHLTNECKTELSTCLIDQTNKQTAHGINANSVSTTHPGSATFFFIGATGTAVEATD